MLLVLILLFHMEQVSFISRLILNRIASSDVTLHTSSVGSEGNTQAHDNMPPFQVLSYIIAYEGEIPSVYFLSFIL